MTPRPGRRVLAIVASTVVALAIVAGMLAVGTPGEERDRKLDAKRLQNLRQLSNGLRYRFDGGGTLPASLAEMTSRPKLPPDMVDPATGEPYGYERLDDSTFRLCATFDHATSDDAAMADDPTMDRFEHWEHRAGRQCWRFRIGHFERPGEMSPLLPMAEENTDSAR